MKRVLSGVRVVELGTYVAAPALGNMLAMLGAKVVKVEPPGGDPTRSLTPWSWVSYNWNKESVQLNLKSTTGTNAINRLLKTADVFVEGMSARTVHDLGLEFETVRRLNRRIIYCSIKGFASDSSSSQRLGFDTIAQAEGGLMRVTSSDERPNRVGNPCVDLSAALYGAVGILSTLLTGTRKATHIEIPLVDIVVYWNGYWLPYIDAHGKEPSRLGSSHPGFSPYAIFKTADGFMFIGVLTDVHWQRLVSKLGIQSRGELSEMNARIAARDKVNRIVQQAVENLRTSDLLALLEGEVPSASVRSLNDVYHDRELRKRGVVRQISMGGETLSIALPPYFREFVASTNLKDQ